MKKEKSQRKVPICFEFLADETVDLNREYRKNFGHSVLSCIYHELEIDKFLVSRQRSTKLNFDTCICYSNSGPDFK